MDANNIPNEKRVLTLLSSIGKDSYETLRNLLAPANPRQFLGRDCSHSQGTLRAQASDHIGTVCFQQAATKDGRIRC